MRRVRFSLVSIVAAACGAATLLAQQQEPTFRASAHTVAVYPTVTERNGRLVTNLHKNDFQVFDDGKPQDITLFANDVQPITIVAMLDLSGSMTGNIRLLREAAAQLAAHLLPADKARFGSFGDHVSIVSPAFTNNVNDLIRNLWLDLEPGGETPLWNAVSAAMNALQDQEGRRVVLVFTDGYDTSSRAASFEDDVKRAQAEGYMVYTVGLRSSGGGPVGGVRSGYGSGSGGSGFRSVFGAPDPGLKAIAEESGGGYFELKNANELDSTFTRVAEELHRQYVLGFNPVNLDGRLHKIDVRLTSPDLTARARKSYLAMPDK